MRTAFRDVIVQPIRPESVPELIAGLQPLLPADREQLARSSNALRRTRVVHHADELLALCLINALNNGSLRTTAGIFSACYREISDVAVLYRLKHAAPFLRELLNHLLRDGLPPDDAARAVDATVLVSPGSNTSDWRIHAVLAIHGGAVQPVAIDLTAGAGEGTGERLTRAAHPADALLVADRGMSIASQIRDATDAGQRVLVRAALTNLRMTDDDTGKRIDPADLLRQAEELHSGECREWPVALHARGKQPVRARLIACRQSPEAAERERRKVRRRASREGYRTRRSTTEEQSECVWLVTTLAAEHGPAEVGALYRARWEIETWFKHLKSDLGLDRLRCKQREQVETWVLSKLLLAVVVDRLRPVLFPR